MPELEMAGITNGRAPRLERCSSLEANMRCLTGELITMREINSSFGVERAGNIRSLLDSEMALDNRLNMKCHNSLENAGTGYEVEIESNVKLQQEDNTRQIVLNKRKRKQESEHIQSVDDLGSNGEAKVNEHRDLNRREYRSPRRKQESTDSGVRPAALQDGSGKLQIVGGRQPGYMKVKSVLQCEGIASASSEQIETMRLKEVRESDTHHVFGTRRTFFCNSSEHGPIENDKLAKLEEAFAKEKLENKKLRKEVEELKRQMTLLLDFVEQGKEICEHCQSIKQQIGSTLGSRGICNMLLHRPHVRGLPVCAQVSSAEDTGDQSPVGSCMSERETPKAQEPFSNKDENEYYSDVHGKVKMLVEHKSPLGRDLSVDQGSNAECQLWVDLIPHTDDEDTVSPVGEMMNQNCYSIDEAHDLERDHQNWIVRMEKDHTSTWGCPANCASVEKMEDMSAATKDQHVNDDSAIVRTLLLFGQTVSEGSTLTPERNCQSQAPVNTVLRKSSTLDVNRILEEFEDMGQHEGVSFVAKKHEESGFSLKSHSIGSGVDKQGEESVTFIDLECGCTSLKHGDTVGILRLYQNGRLEVYCQCCPACGKGKPMTPPRFEKHAGRAASKKWRESIWIVLGDKKVPFSKIKGLDEFCRRFKDASKAKSANLTVAKQVHRHEFVRCKKCYKERRFRRRNKEECRLFHDAALNPNWECSNFPYDRLSCQDDEEREVRRAIRGCVRSRMCKGCIQCVCLGCLSCRFRDCSCRTCQEFMTNHTEK